ncbi:PIN domain-containing protein [Aquifex aeolicus]|uniref:PIN domain-containing protein n=1 Tax=Aquifex aeolicus TaxID=63363 RepID=UPI003082BE59
MASRKGEKEIIVNANVILRYLLKDHRKLYKEAEELFNKILSGELKVFIPQVVIAEIVYVLQESI